MLAVISIAFGVFSMLSAFLTLLGWISATIGLLLGILGLNEVKQRNKSGLKLANAGIICNSLGIVLPLVFFLMAQIFFW